MILRLSASRVLPLLACAALSAVAIAFVAPGARAQDGADAVTIDAAVGLGDVVPPSAHAPVVVDVTATDPVSGRLLVAAATDTGRVVERRDVELAAGATRRYRFLVPRGFDLRVQFVPDDGGEPVTVRAAVARNGRHVVAALGGDGAPKGLTTPVTATAVDATVLDPEWLDLGPDVLGGVDTVIVTRTDLLALDAGRRRTVESAVTAGMQLLVTQVDAADLGLTTSPVLDDLDPIPGAWSTTSAALLPADGPTADDDADADAAPDVAVTTMVHGRGAITIVSGALDDRADLTSMILRPRDRLELLRVRDLTSFGSQAILQGSVGGIGDLPPIWVLALGMGGYLLVVGPVNALVLGRLRRRELAWLTVPAITIVVIGAAALLAGRVGGAGIERQAIAWLDGTDGTATTIVGVQATGRDVTEIALDGDAWSVSAIGFQSQAIVDRDGGATLVSLELASRESGGIRASRPVDTPAPLDVEAAVVDDRLRLEVTNTIDVPVTEVHIRIAGVTRRIADALGPGETLIRDLELPDALPSVDRIEPFGRFDGAGQFIERPADESDGTARGVFVGLGGLATVDPLPGVVWVLADAPTTAVPSSGGRIDGRAPEEFDVLLAVGVTPTPTSAATSVFETPLRLVEGRVDQLGVQAPAFVSGDGEFVLAFDLPREGELTRLVTDLGKERVADRCIQLDRSGPDVPGGFQSEEVCGPDATTEIECPQGATSCSSGPDFSEVCLEDGTCESRYIAGPFQEGAFRVEVWDPTTRTWTQPGADIPLSAVDPLGRVTVRLLDAFEVNLAGRGLGGELR